MGIPLYFKYLKNNHRDVVKKLYHSNNKPCTPCDTLYFDFNCIVHNCAHEHVNGGEDVIIKASCEYVHKIISYVQPRKGVFISVDGVPPFSKMVQQRQRRFMSNRNRDQDPSDEYSWDSNCVTPGTPFMSKLNVNLKGMGSNIEISDSDEKGEGEQKIFKRIKACTLPEKSVVYGLDADLHMLSLLCPKADITVLRPNSQTPGEYFLIDINRLKKVVWKSIGRPDISIDKGMKEYVCLCSLMGNDFIPGITSLPVCENSMDIIFKSYREVSKTKNIHLLVENYGKVNMEFYLNIIDILTDYEDQGMIESDKNYYARKTEASKFPDVIKPSEQGWRQRYYSYLFQPTDKIDDICYNYLEGVQWSMRYHMTQEVDPWWSYKYSYAPTLFDLAKRGPLSVNSSTSSLFTVDPKIQMLAVLPADYLCKTFPNYKDIIKMFTHFYPSNFPVLSYLKNHVSECVPLIPRMDYSSLSKMMRSFSLVSS
jgi:5'-3' exoribonuclease 1